MLSVISFIIDGGGSEFLKMFCCVFQRKRKPRGWMSSVSSPRELLAQLFFLQNRSRFSEDREEAEEEEGSSSYAGRELVDLILNFNDDDDDGEDGVSLDDFFS